MIELTLASYKMNELFMSLDVISNSVYQSMSLISSINLSLLTFVVSRLNKFCFRDDDLSI